MLASKIEQKSMLSSRGHFLKKPCFSFGKSMIFKDLGVEVGTKNPLKIDQKRSSTWEGLLASIFSEFWWILEAKLAPSWHPKSIKNQSKKASKNRCQKEGDKIGKHRQKSRLGGVLARKSRRDMQSHGGYAWASLRPNLANFCPSVLNTPYAPCEAGAGG